jgi:hypothetical protein
MDIYFGDYLLRGSLVFDRTLTEGNGAGGSNSVSSLLD